MISKVATLFKMSSLQQSYKTCKGEGKHGPYGGKEATETVLRKAQMLNLWDKDLKKKTIFWLEILELKSILTNENSLERVNRSGQVDERLNKLDVSIRLFSLETEGREEWKKWRASEVCGIQSSIPTYANGSPRRRGEKWRYLKK